MSIVALATSSTPSPPSVQAESADVEFERRWAAWKARGLAHERIVRRRFIIVAIVIVAIAVAALAASRLLPA